MMRRDEREESLLGRQVEGYTLVRVLGRGSMAVVLLGERLGAAPRAFKFIREEYSQNDDFVRRFAEEVCVLDELTHQHIVRSYHSGRLEPEGLWYMELELLDGDNLDSKVNAEAPADAEQAVEWVLQAARGVAYAHRMGLVHRDLKPSNLFLARTRAGELIKVVDFGISRALDAALRTGGKATRAGTVPGTPAYMAPELGMGGQAGTAADVYALGVTLYELVLGYHPLLPPGEEPPLDTQLLVMHTQPGIPPLSALKPGAHPELVATLERLLARDPKARPADGQALVAELEALAAKLKLPPSRPTQPQASPARVVAGTQLANLLPTLDDMDAGGRREEVMSVTGGTARVVTGPAPEPPEVIAARRATRVRRVAGAVVVVAALAAGGYVGTRPAPVDPMLLVSSSLASERVGKAVEAGQAAMAAEMTRAEQANKWVRVRGGAGTLGVNYKRIGLHDLRNSKEEQAIAAQLTGFREDSVFRAPSLDYEIQQREVTWEEYEAWQATSAGAPYSFERPPWVPGEAAARAKLPVAGMLPGHAQAYCQSLGGALPTEAQWEWAARGKDTHIYPHGDSAPDATVALSGTMLVPGCSASGDRTVGSNTEGVKLCDMLGNAREWTSELWRDGTSHADDAHLVGENTLWVVRGWRQEPLLGDMRLPPHGEGLAYRGKLIGAGPVAERSRGSRAMVGFRCVRDYNKER
jgi:serine/threonine protein kinase/formylglycine-generating enzyme required for sulfatase activity